MLSVPLVLGFAAGYFYLLAGRYASTDDAYAQADMVQVSADVGGRVVAVDVHDNEKVMPGQVLFRLDRSQLSHRGRARPRPSSRARGCRSTACAPPIARSSPN